MNYKFLKINKIGGIYYTNKEKSDSIIIYGIGAPLPPDYGWLPDAPIILQQKIDIFVPDYIGYGRSGGRFTPKNCIKTFLDLYGYFRRGCIAKNFYEGSQVFLRYERIIFIGRSFGGTYVPLLPRFNKEIKELALFYPVVDSKSCGSVKGEETNEDFLNAMRYDGYRYLYRGILSKQWEDHLENRDDLSPMDNIKHLKKVRMFIGHGKKDHCVNYKKSVKYYQKVLKAFPNRESQFKLVLYSEGGHGKDTSQKAVEDFLTWIR